MCRKTKSIQLRAILVGQCQERDAQTTCGDLPLMAGSDNRALAISPPPQISFSYHLFFLCLQKTTGA